MKLSVTQQRALELLARGGFIRSRAGWHAPDDGDSLHAFSTPTLTALAKRGFVRLRGRGRSPRPCAAYITAAGRAALRVLASRQDDGCREHAA